MFINTSNGGFFVPVSSLHWWNKDRGCLFGISRYPVYRAFLYSSRRLILSPSPRNEELASRRKEKKESHTHTHKILKNRNLQLRALWLHSSSSFSSRFPAVSPFNVIILLFALWERLFFISAHRHEPQSSLQAPRFDSYASFFPPYLYGVILPLHPAVTKSAIEGDFVSLKRWISSFYTVRSMRTFLACSSEPLLNGLSVCGTTDAPVRPRFLPLNVLILSEVFFCCCCCCHFPFEGSNKTGQMGARQKRKKRDELLIYRKGDWN